MASGWDLCVPLLIILIRGLSEGELNRISSIAIARSDANGGLDLLQVCGIWLFPYTDLT